MVIGTADTLVRSIREAGLLEPPRLDDLPFWVARFPEALDLARRLVHADWLTPFQANQLLLGRGHFLVLGPYIVLGRLGMGNMGEVFRARHRHFQRDAALKIIRQQRLRHPNAVQRFLREAQVAAGLSHPNIVAVYDAGVVNDTEGEEAIHFLAMELIEGIDLDRLLTQTGPLPISQACDFIRQAALGLHHAHEQGLVHRDIKPPNLLVAPRTPLAKPLPQPLTADLFLGGTVKVLDLGLVRLLEKPEDDEMGPLTQHGVVIGTVDYVAPEQVRNSRTVDRRADLYALGCTFYQLLTAQPPFPGGQPLDKLLRHLSAEPPSLLTLRADVPPSLADLVHKLMAKDPDQRFQTAAEVALALVPYTGLPGPLAEIVFPPTLPSTETQVNAPFSTRVIGVGPPPLSPSLEVNLPMPSPPVSPPPLPKMPQRIGSELPFSDQLDLRIGLMVGLGLFLLAVVLGMLLSHLGTP